MHGHRTLIFPEPRNDLRMGIPDRHSEDLFVGVCVEGFDRQSAFRQRDGGRSTARPQCRCAGVGWASAEGPPVATGITQDAGNDKFRI